MTIILNKENAKGEVWDPSPSPSPGHRSVLLNSVPAYAHHEVSGSVSA
jgi:hypothetical protein